MLILSSHFSLVQGGWLGPRGIVDGCFEAGVCMYCMYVLDRCNGQVCWIDTLASSTGSVFTVPVGVFRQV